MHRITTPTTPKTVAALLAGPAVTALGMAITPWETGPGTAAYQAALEAHPLQGQLAALTLMAGYALTGLTAAAILLRARGRTRPLLWTVAAVLAFLGATILPGMVAIDFYDLALAQTLPEPQAVAVADHVQGYGLALVPRILGVAGFALGGLLVLVTAWRARLVGGWAPLLMVGGFVIPGVLLPGAAGIIAGSVLSVVPYAGIALRLRRRVPIPASVAGAAAGRDTVAAERPVPARPEVMAHIL